MTDLTLDEAAALAPIQTPDAAIAKVAAGAVLVDVRGAEGRARDGVIDGAIFGDRYNIPAEFLPGSATTHPEIVDLDTPIVVVCGSVRGSGPVAAELVELGFRNVTHVEGGFPAWQEASGVAVSGDGEACAV